MKQERMVPRIEPVEYRLDSGERIFIHLFRPEDAPGIVRLFRAVYGDDYPVKRYYDPDALTTACETGENYSIVARTEDGEIIGHVGLFRSSPYPGLYECGTGLVLPERRKSGVGQLVMHQTYERLAPAMGIEEVWGEPVCNHLHMQKMVVEHKHVETGLEVDLMPAETFAVEKTSSGRVSVMPGFRCYKSRPHTVYLPPVYEDPLKILYSTLDDRRTIEIVEGQPPAGSSSSASFEVFEFPQVVRIAVTAIGRDFESYFSSLEEKLLARNIKVFQVWVNLARPWTGSAVEVLRGRGYFIGGILPRWFDDDGMLMQKVTEPPNWEGIRLYSARAAQILEIIKKDRDEVCRETS